MKIVHRYDSEERQHYLLEQSYTFHLKPRLLYVGSLSKQEKWSEISHSHQFVEILFIVDGKGTVVFENSKKTYKKATLSFITPMFSMRNTVILPSRWKLYLSASIS